MIVRSPYDRIHQNLAWEDLIFNAWQPQEPDERHILLYVNRPAVVIGRFQNPWRELRLDLCQKRGIELARRISGGGCVYHDPGNLNISMFSSRTHFSRDALSRKLAALLRGFGIQARVNNRADVYVADRKVSGSAYRIVKEKAYHHVTLLIDADVSAIEGVLGPMIAGIEGQGVASVSAPVINLRQVRPDIDLEQIVSAISTQWSKDFGQELSVFPDDSEVQVRSGELAAQEWLFGKTPAFTLPTEDGLRHYPAGQLPDSDGYSIPGL